MKSRLVVAIPIGVPLMEGSNSLIVGVFSALEAAGEACFVSPVLRERGRLVLLAWMSSCVVLAELISESPMLINARLTGKELDI